MNTCYDCIPLEENINRFGTADLFRDQGFVKNLPQHWNFKIREELRDIHLKEKPDGSGDIEVVWGLGKKKQNNVNNLVDNVNHLEQFENTHQRSTRGDIPKDEWNLLWQYFDALKTANKAVISHMNIVNYNEDAIQLDKDNIFHDRTQGYLGHRSYLYLEPFCTDQYEDKEVS
eukprot:11652940-Ditylum_brightwellii.AAC.1